MLVRLESDTFYCFQVAKCHKCVVRYDRGFEMCDECGPSCCKSNEKEKSVK